MWLRPKGRNREELGSLGVSWGKQGQEGAGRLTTLHLSAPPVLAIPSTIAKTLGNVQASECPQ